MKRLKLNMLSVAESVKGQGVGSAYQELIRLLKTQGRDRFAIKINGSLKNCDIIHVHTINIDSFIKLLFFKGPKIVHVHFLPSTLDGSLRMPKFCFAILKKYVIALYKMADALVVVNPSLIPAMVNHGLKREKIHYIPNFVSKNQFYPCTKAQTNKKRKELGLSEDDFMVLGAGQIQTRKGVWDFLEVARKMPDIRFIWAGGFSFGMITDGYDKLKQAVEKPPANVTFLGIVDREEMNLLFNACDVYFSPSFDELFPMTILEAASVHKPILLRDLVLYENILMGNYCSAKDVPGMINMINELRKDSGFYQTQCENSKQIASTYSEETLLETWTKFYRRIYLRYRSNNEKK